MATIKLTDEQLAEIDRQRATPTPVPTPTPTPTPSGQRYYAYFGCDLAQITETADHCNTLFTAPWGPRTGHPSYPPGVDFSLDWQNTMTAWLVRAKAAGYKHSILSVTHQLWDNNWRYIGTGYLPKFRTMLETAGVLDMVVALYITDEPNFRENGNMSDSTLLPILSAVRGAWPGLPLAIIYGEGGGFPGLSGVDWAGIDHYKLGAGILTRQPPIRPGQKLMLVPSSSMGEQNVSSGDRWGPADPAPFLAYANTHPEVVAMIPWMWGDHYYGRGARSLPSTQAAYRAAAKAFLS